jgi:uncharacterized protein DUF6702
MVAAGRFVALGALLLFGMGARATDADAHPLHTTLTELTTLPDGTAQIVMRVFLDDLSAAVTRRPPAPAAPIPMPPDSAVARYLGEAVLLTDGAGRRMPLIVAGMRRTDDLVWVTLRAQTPRSMTGAHLAMRVLFDRWDDQVNIVQCTIGARRQTLLFTRREGSAAKPI